MIILSCFCLLACCFLFFITLSDWLYVNIAWLIHWTVWKPSSLHQKNGFVDRTEIWIKQTVFTMPPGLRTAQTTSTTTTQIKLTMTLSARENSQKYLKSSMTLRQECRNISCTNISTDSKMDNWLTTSWVVETSNSADK